MEIYKKLYLHLAIFLHKQNVWIVIYKQLSYKFDFIQNQIICLLTSSHNILQK